VPVRVLKPTALPDEDMKIDFTLQTFTTSTSSLPTDISPPPISPTSSSTQGNVKGDIVNESKIDVVDSSIILSSSSKPVQDESSHMLDSTKVLSQDSIESFSLSSPPLSSINDDDDSQNPNNSYNNGSSNNSSFVVTSQRRLSSLTNPVAFALTSDTEIERLQVEVQVHTQNQSPTDDMSNNENDDNTMDSDYYTDIIDSSHLSESHIQLLDTTELSSIIKTLTFSDEEDEDVDEVTDVSCLSIRNNYVENDNSIEDAIDDRARKDNKEY
jgi:hypothetical protein